MIEPTAVRPVRSLDCLLAPRSVAVVGASQERHRIGGRPLHYLLHGCFSGPVLAINPKRESVQGVPSYPSISALPEPVDLAIIAVPGSVVIPTLHECADRGVGAAVVFSSGFAELGDAGRRAQAQLRQLAHDSGMRILGPNCLGLYNAALGVFATFSSTLELGTPRAGPVAVVSQSGAYGGHVAYLARQRGIDVGTLLTTGNECDVEMAEGMAWMAARDEVKVIAAVAEGPRDGDRLVQALELARAHRKPVVFLKMGRSKVGADAAQSHTDSLAGEDRVFDAVLEAHGAYRARDTEELLDVAYAASFGKFPNSRNVGLMSVSGGAGIQLADAAERYALNVPPMPASTQARLKARMPFASPVNPVDITAQVFNDRELLPLNLNAMLEEASYPAIVTFFTYVAGTGSMGEQLLEEMTAAARRHPDRLLVHCLIAPRDRIANYEAAGSPCFEDPDRAVRAVSVLAYFAQAFKRQPVSVERGSCIEIPSGALSEERSLALLARAGLPAPTVQVVANAEQAVQVAAQFKGGVVLKLSSADIPHKSDVGGVLIDVEGDEAVARGFDTLMRRARQRAPSARIDGVMVMPLAAPGVDMILGLRRDPLFGPMVMVGLGGIFVEVLEDVAIAPAPVDGDTARSMIESLRARSLLAGVRGGVAGDIDALVNAVIDLSHFALRAGSSLDSVDINPLRVFAQGEGVLMLDALVVPSSQKPCRKEPNVERG